MTTLGNEEVVFSLSSSSVNTTTGKQTREIDECQDFGSHLPLVTLSNEEVVWVDGPATDAKFQDCVDAALVAAETAGLHVGLDTEWQDPRPLSVVQFAIQIGTAAVIVFLIDMLRLLPESTLSAMRRLLQGERPYHQVIVFAAREDVKRLILTNVLRVDGADGKDSALLDKLQWTDLQALDWQLGAQPSLQAVVANVLKARLDKMFQCSSWDNRPLSDGQISYAALDASVLLRLHKHGPKSELSRSREVRGKQKKGAPRKEPPAASREQERERWRRYHRSPSRICSQICIGGNSDEKPGAKNEHLRFLLPADLSRLMRKMRGLGLDSWLLPAGARPKDVARAALSEDRIILTRSKRLELPAEAVGRAYLLRSDTSDEQLREIIDVFGVEITEECLCGRCVHCNSWDWQLATRDQVIGNPQLKEKTIATYDSFWVCGGCGKIFWEGGMHEKAISHFATFMSIGSSQLKDKQYKDEAVSDTSTPELLEKPLHVPFSATFANGKVVEAISLNSEGLQLNWSNGTFYTRDTCLCPSGDVRGEWVDRGRWVHIQKDVITGPNNGWFPALITRMPD